MASGDNSSDTSLSGSNTDYHKSHWADIEPDRLERYDALFHVTDEAADRVLSRVGAQPGETILDFGCGPGYVANQLARMVGPEGHVHGVDLNADFLARAAEVARDAGRDGQITLHHSTNETVPLDDDSVDRVYVKNVLEYVPDPVAVLVELRRVLRPGGELVVSDSDFGFVVVEPLEPSEVAELFNAAGPAFKDPYIGRHLRGHLATAGFEGIKVDVGVFVDTAGRLRSVVANMIGYARRFDRLTAERADEFDARLDAAVADGSFMAVLPQWWVRGRA